MTLKLSRDEARLLALAQEQEVTIQDPAVRECWYVVTEAIANRWLVPEGRMSLHQLIVELERGSGAGAEEYSIDVDDENDRYVVAAFVTSSHRCPREAMLRELRRLEHRRRGEPDPPEGNASSSQPCAEVPDPEELRRAFQILAGAGSSELPSSEAGDFVRNEALEELARLAGSPEALASDEVRQALTGLTADDRGRIAVALRTFAAWAERPEEGGDAIDEAIRMLEATLGWIPQGGRAETEATEKRIADSARDAIARRLGGQGAQSGGDAEHK